MIVNHQSLLLDLRSTGVEGRLGSKAHNLATMVTEDHDTKRYIDADLLAPGDMLVVRYRVIRGVGKGGFGSVILVEDTAIGEEIGFDHRVGHFWALRMTSQCLNASFLRC